MQHHNRWVRNVAVMILLLAAWLFWRIPLAVPPGIEMDELIEAQIAEQILAGDFRPFYEAGQGREALYHYWLAAWITLLGKTLFTIRMASTTLALLGAAWTYRFVRRLFGGYVALLSMSLSITSFWFLLTARSGLRSAALPLLASLSAYYFWRSLGLPGDRRRSRHIPRRASNALSALLAAIALGLSFYSYTAARVLPLIFATFLAYVFVGHRTALAGRGRSLLLWVIVTLVLVTPFWRYLRAHPEADQFDFMEFDRPLAALESGDPEPALRTSMATLGMFAFRGDPLIFDNVPGRPVFTGLASVLFLLGAAVAVWRWRQPGYLFVLVWVFISLVPGMLSQPAPNFYRTIGAQVVAGVFPAIAIVEIARFVGKRRPRFRQIWMIAAVGTLAVGLQLAVTWRDYFSVWPSVEGVPFFWQTGLAQTARYLNKSKLVEDMALCTVLTYEFDPWWRPAWQSMSYLLQRDDLRVRYYDCRTSFVLPSTRSGHYIFTEPTAAALYVPYDSLDFRGSEDSLVSGALPPDMGMVYHLEEAAWPTAEVERGSVSYAPEAGGQTGSVPVNFGETLLLLGYDYALNTEQSGKRLSLKTAWQVIRRPPPFLALFTHVISEPATIIAQQDGLPLTPQSLQEGDRFWVLHDQIWLPPEETTEPYVVSIGIYDSKTMVRVPLYVSGESRGDRLMLDPLGVE